MTHTTALLQWQAHSPHESSYRVLPDGCHDLILRLPPAGRPRWLAVPLMDRAELVHSQAGEQFIGFRLKPWAQVDKTAIAAALQGRNTPDPAEALSLLASALRVDTRLAEALSALALAPSVSAACRELGVAERSLQRLVSGQTGRTPSYWRALARVRRAAQELQGPALPNLHWADMAAAHGFADQAHLCREFRRWFACTPAQFLARPEYLSQVAEQGFV